MSNNWRLAIRMIRIFTVEAVEWWALVGLSGRCGGGISAWTWAAVCGYFLAAAGMRRRRADFAIFSHLQQPIFFGERLTLTREGRAMTFTCGRSGSCYGTSLGIWDAEDDLGIFVEADVLRRGGDDRSASFAGDFEAQDYVGEIEYAFAKGGERFDAVFVGADAIGAVIGLVGDGVDGDYRGRGDGLKLQMQRGGGAVLQLDGIEIDHDSIELAWGRGDEMGDLTDDERALGEMTWWPSFTSWVMRASMRSPCWRLGIYFAVSLVIIACRRKIDRVRGGLGGPGGLRGGAEWEQEDEEQVRRANRNGFMGAGRLRGLESMLICDWAIVCAICRGLLLKSLKAFWEGRVGSIPW